MKIVLLTLALVFGINGLTNGQVKIDKPKEVPQWTEADRKYLLDNLMRGKEELLAETKELSKEQWNFKESPDRWSISQIVEHICLWELLQTHEISRALQIGPFPNFDQYLPDSLFRIDTKATKKNITTEFTKPFTYGVPLGNNEGKNNVIWFTTLRNESIDFLKKETKNLREHYIYFGPNIHQQYMMIFGHTFRHLTQIRKVKEHPNYPKK
jgi:DinB superfamily